LCVGSPYRRFGKWPIPRRWSDAARKLPQNRILSDRTANIQDLKGCALLTLDEPSAFVIDDALAIAPGRRDERWPAPRANFLRGLEEVSSAVELGHAP